MSSFNNNRVTDKFLEHAFVHGLYKYSKFTCLYKYEEGDFPDWKVAQSTRKLENDILMKKKPISGYQAIDFLLVILPGFEPRS